MVKLNGAGPYDFTVLDRTPFHEFGLQAEGSSTTRRVSKEKTAPIGAVGDGNVVVLLLPAGFHDRGYPPSDLSEVFH